MSVLAEAIYIIIKDSSNDMEVLDEIAPWFPLNIS